MLVNDFFINGGKIVMELKVCTRETILVKAVCQLFQITKNACST